MIFICFSPSQTSVSYILNNIYNTSKSTRLKNALRIFYSHHAILNHFHNGRPCDCCLSIACSSHWRRPLDIFGQAICFARACSRPRWNNPETSLWTKGLGGRLLLYYQLRGRLGDSVRCISRMCFWLKLVHLVIYFQPERCA
jgi:hypothetical protein